MPKKRNALSEKAKRIFTEEMQSAARDMNIDADEVMRAAEAFGATNVRQETNKVLCALQKAQEHKSTVGSTKPRRSAKKMRPKRGLKPYQLRAIERQMPPTDGPKIHIIHPDGTVDSRVWGGRLEDKHPPFDDLGPLIDVRPCDIAHVKVLFNGKKMWMFVDDDGKARSEYVLLNWKASAVYANMRFFMGGATHLLYGDLSKDPEMPMEGYVLNKLVVVGTVVLWEGGLE